jgi:hypothetical protein
MSFTRSMGAVADHAKAPDKAHVSASLAADEAALAMLAVESLAELAKRTQSHLLRGLGH